MPNVQNHKADRSRRRPPQDIAVSQNDLEHRAKLCIFIFFIIGRRPAWAPDRPAAAPRPLWAVPRAVTGRRLGRFEPSVGRPLCLRGDGELPQDGYDRAFPHSETLYWLVRDMYL